MSEYPVSIPIFDIENRVDKVESFIQGVVDDSTKLLDKRIIELSEKIMTASPQELATLVTRLGEELYNVSTLSEQIGAKADTAKMIMDHTYNNAFIKQEGGTVDFKKAVAQESAREKELYYIAYSRGYKAVKAKIDTCYELINIVKKQLALYGKQFDYIPSGVASGSPNLS